MNCGDRWSRYTQRQSCGRKAPRQHNFKTEFVKLPYKTKYKMYCIQVLPYSNLLLQHHCSDNKRKVMFNNSWLQRWTVITEKKISPERCSGVKNKSNEDFVFGTGSWNTVKESSLSLMARQTAYSDPDHDLHLVRDKNEITTKLI